MFGYAGSLPWSGIPGTLWIRADKMEMHPLTTVLKAELEGEITYNLGYGEVVTQNDQTRISGQTCGAAVFQDVAAPFLY